MYIYPIYMLILQYMYTYKFTCTHVLSSHRPPPQPLPYSSAVEQWAVFSSSFLPFRGP